MAVIGAGPAGIATAMFLRRNGVGVDVYEKLDGPYGIVRRIIPTFRITREQVDRDYRLAVATGVDFHFGCDPDYDLADLRRRFDHVVVATGAWGGVPAPSTAGRRSSVTRSTSSGRPRPRAGRRAGHRVAVIGAGDVAMDCARTALRTDGRRARHARLPAHRAVHAGRPGGRRRRARRGRRGARAAGTRSPTTVRCCAASAPSSVPGRTTADARPAAPGPSSTSPSTP